jgi:hypothetical protein
VAGFWDDMYLPGGSGLGASLKYIYDGVDRFIVQWTNVPHFALTTDPYTYQIILQSDGRIYYNYLDMQGVRNSATVGIENATGSVGLLVNFNETGLGGRIGNNVAVRFTYPDVVPPTITHTPLVDTPAPGPYVVSADITDASGVASATLHYQVNGGGYSTVPMVLLVPPTTYGALIPDQTAPAAIDYYITAVDGAPGANTATSATWTFNKLFVPCAAPTGVAVAMSSGNANLSWTAVPGAVSYNIYSATDGYGTYTLLGTSATTSFTDVGAQPAGRRFYKVTANCD